MEVQRLLRWALLVELGLLAALAGTGFWLTAYYRPTANQAFRVPQRHEQIVRVVHNRLSYVFVVGAVVVLGLGITFAIGRLNRRRWWASGGGAAALLLALGLSYTGYLLPWDQLALRSVTVGSNWNGLWSASFSHAVRFVLIGGAEVGQPTVRNWFVVHAVVLPILAVGVSIGTYRAIARHSTPA